MGELTTTDPAELALRLERSPMGQNEGARWIVKHLRRLAEIDAAGAKALEWVKKGSDYYEAQVSERVFLDALESHSGWKARIWVRDQYDEKRLASPIERAGLRTVIEAQAAGAQLLREWAAGLLPPPAASKEDGHG